MVQANSMREKLVLQRPMDGINDLNIDALVGMPRRYPHAKKRQSREAEAFPQSLD